MQKNGFHKLENLSHAQEGTFAESLTSALLCVNAPHDFAKFITASVAKPDPDPTPYVAEKNSGIIGK